MGNSLGWFGCGLHCANGTDRLTGGGVNVSERNQEAVFRTADEYLQTVKATEFFQDLPEEKQRDLEASLLKAGRVLPVNAVNVDMGTTEGRSPRNFLPAASSSTAAPVYPTRGAVRAGLVSLGAPQSAVPPPPLPSDVPGEGRSSGPPTPVDGVSIAPAGVGRYGEGIQPPPPVDGYGDVGRYPHPPVSRMTRRGTPFSLPFDRLSLTPAAPLSLVEALDLLEQDDSPSAVREVYARLVRDERQHELQGVQPSLLPGAGGVGRREGGSAAGMSYQIATLRSKVRELEDVERELGLQLHSAEPGDRAHFDQLSIDHEALLLRLTSLQTRLVEMEQLVERSLSDAATPGDVATGNRHISDAALPLFSPSCGASILELMDFLEEVDTACAIHHVLSPSARAQFFARCLTASARDWYSRFIRQYPWATTSYAVLRVGLVYRFCGANVRSLLEGEWLKLLWDGVEPIADFRGRLERLATLLGQDDCAGAGFSSKLYGCLPSLWQRKLCDAGIFSTAPLPTVLKFIQEQEKWTVAQEADARGASAPGGRMLPRRGGPISGQRSAALEVHYLGDEGGVRPRARRRAAASRDRSEDEVAAAYEDRCFMLSVDDSYFTEFEDQAICGTSYGGEGDMWALTDEVLADDYHRTLWSFWVAQPHRSRGRSDTIVCYQCDGMGHTARDCTSRDAPCYFCGESGHQRAACPERRRQPSATCAYCQVKGHIESGCFRKRRGLPAIPPTFPASRHAIAQSRTSLGQHVASQIDRRVEVGEPGGAPSEDELRRLIRLAAQQLTPTERASFIAQLQAEFEQDHSKRVASEPAPHRSGSSAARHFNQPPPQDFRQQM